MTKEEWEQLDPQDKKEIINLIEFKERLKMITREQALENKRKREERRKAYELVLADLREVPMFEGHFDAINGSEKFMYGVNTVMEFIAYQCSAKICDEFENIFLKNFQESLDKANKQ